MIFQRNWKNRISSADDFTYGFGGKVWFKGFDLDFNFQGVYGNEHFSGKESHQFGSIQTFMRLNNLTLFGNKTLGTGVDSCFRGNRPENGQAEKRTGSYSGS